MQPTLENDDVLLVNKLSRLFSKQVLPGKLYIFISPSDPEKLICKRVVAIVRKYILFVLI